MEKMMMINELGKAKAVVLMSGGLDSSVLVGTMKHWGMTVHSIFVQYGQKHFDREFAAYMSICDALDIKPHIINFEIAMQGLRSSLIQSSGIAIEDEVVRGEQGGTYVPMRNALFLSAAAGIAESLDYDLVAYAGHAEDAEANYPDCTPEFVIDFNQMLYSATQGKVSLYAPFINDGKDYIVRRGADIDIPLELTYSCYRGGEKHCGTCPTCLGRKQAFIDAGVKDPTVYLTT